MEKRRRRWLCNIQFWRRHFHRMVLEKVNDDLKTNAMTSSGLFRKWQKENDILVYLFSDIICKIYSPLKSLVAVPMMLLKLVVTENN